MKLACAIAAFATLAAPALANDSIAGFGVGGLELRQTDAIALLREDLFVSLDEIRVDYVFRNETDETVTAIVAFPLPAVGGDEWMEGYAYPEPGRLDYVGFTTVVDGVEVVMTAEHRVSLDGIDRTSDFEAIGVHAVAVQSWDILDAASRTWTQEQWTSLREQGFVDAEGRPRWVLQSTYWREQSFAPHTEVAVSHRYRPVAGGSVDSWFPGAPIPESLDPERAESWARYAETIETMRARYCVTPEDEERMRAQENGETGLVGYSTFISAEIDYILKTGANWRGPIGHFRAVIEAPQEWDFVFVCLPGAQRDAQHRIVFEARDFVPDRDLSVYISRAVGEAIPAVED